MAAKAGAGRGGRIERLPSPLTLDQFDMGITLGTGSFGRVRFAIHKVWTIMGGRAARVHRREQWACAVAQLAAMGNWRGSPSRVCVRRRRVGCGPSRC
jgi:hypothetical protein